MKRIAHKPVDLPIQRLTLVDEIERPQPLDFRSESLPGHLIHVVEAGEVRQVSEGRPERLRAGCVVWYHENEPTEGRILRAPWRFITINFLAPRLAPPPDDQRVLRAGPRTLSLARQLLDLWRNASLPAVERSLRCVATLAELILDFRPLAETPLTAEVYPANARERWWALEKKLRHNLDRPMKLETLARMAGMSARTTIRACRAATGRTPAQRIKDLRLTYAHGLLQHADLPVTEIALQVGYQRVQELSRDIKNRYGVTPRELRRRAPDYRVMQRKELKT